ncbi:MAG: iron-containing alcohol dehydrogenase [Spirochaetia bacterium]|jgi:alcohol dehydrogenase class IV|nr:iron-containing alcohol dehydrogenase [Spirochaetales bacterium]MDX9783147.1 iron-containing alcohol dehydrogenase [Spirochaetia bacterium]
MAKTYAAKRLWFNLAARGLTVLRQKLPTLLTGKGSLKLLPSELEVQKASKPLIVTDASLIKIGLVSRLTTVLSESSIPFAIFDGVLPDPSFEICEYGLAVLKDNGCDSVIALGGGSVIDAAKIIRMAATHKKPVSAFKGLLPCRNSGLPFICVPTTAGTGSEATAAAVITDQKQQRKITVLDPRLPPDSAILDPELCVGLPPAMTAATGMDALTHAVEAYTNTLHYSDVDMQALEATRLVFANLRGAYSHGEDLEAREAMLRASHLAGRAFTRGFVGYIHAVAHRFGERYHIPHGLANAITLPYFIDLYRGVVPERLADLAAAAGLGGGGAEADVEEQAAVFVEALRRLNKDLGIPEKAEFLRRKDIPGIAAAALKEAHGTPYPVPVILDAAGLESVIALMLPD